MREQKGMLSITFSAQDILRISVCAKYQVKSISNMAHANLKYLTEFSNLMRVYYALDQGLGLT